MANHHHAGLTGPENRRSLSPAHLWRAVLTAAGVIIIFLGGTEIAQRIWLHDLADAHRHMVHLARGAFCSVLVAVAVCWTILKHSPELLAPEPVDADWTKYPLMPKERLHHYARWFVTMRWIAVMLAGLLIFVGVQLLDWLPAEVWWPLTLTVAALAGLNVLYTTALRWHGMQYIFLQLQVYVDLVILTLLLHFSGGIENPLSMMMIFHVVIGGILLSRRQCYWIAGVASGLFALLAWAEWSEWVTHYTLTLFPHDAGESGELLHAAHSILYVTTWTTLLAIVLFLTAYFVTTLADRLRDHESRLRTMAERAVAGQQLLEQAMETAGAGLRVLNPELGIHWANTRWREWFTEPDGRPQSWAGLDGAGSPAAQTRLDGEVRVTEVARPDPATGRGAAKSIFQITTAPLRDVNGAMTRVVELAQDITAQKRTQAQMLRAGQLAAVGELAGKVAHEVNNPIAIISAKARLLLADHGSEMSPKVAQEVSKITECADRVARVAKGLLSYCRPAPTNRAPIDLRLPIRRSLAMVEHYARRSGVAVREDLTGVLPSVSADANELEQVFLNLFLNALDAMPQGGELKIYAPGGPMLLRDGRPCLAVAVEDTGTGIPEPVRERIFEPFFTTKTEGHGTGLGLSICQGLVRSHGGEIELKDGANHGACFVVKLPIAAGAAASLPHG